ncbi:NAD-dependent epimerase/dehydratase family protein [Paenibacillus allorhizosphaerae]|uniref:Aurachin B dehydrogenase n=1 Tax=Paenibacillus allorhizosphaerae TaxID=2849866 RepID=A0ABM8VAM5_9BACL|nr:NAD(P)-dependent oxidoreductase [Paenibacillus allorhizosphaerae]CAG7615109.1 Aurachin B dehydrogenase [Paenibacillus allorhizosphaerae]
MKVLITGATGRIGSRLVQRLLQKGYSVSMLVRQPERVQALKNLGAEIIQGDLLQPESLIHAAANQDVIIHLAAFFRGATAEETHSVNLEGTVALARAALQAGVSRFIFASTNLVYGPGRLQPFVEDDLPYPAAPYPKSKAAAEQKLLELQRTDGLGLTILRLAFVYGEGDPHLEEGLRWFRNWNPAQPIHMVHHADVAQAIILAAENERSVGHIFNVADDEPVPVGDIMSIYNEPIAGDSRNRPVDSSWLQIVATKKIREQLGFKPIYPALRNAVESGTL